MATNGISLQQNRGIFVHDDGRISAEAITTAYTPSTKQALIRVEHSAINPADIRHAYMGLYKTSSVAGYEWLGTVVEAGKETSYAVGQRLFGMTAPDFAGGPRSISSGAHQDFLLTE